jgi:hypothetical protein
VRLALLDKLSRADQAPYNSASRNFASSCLEGTRKALLQDIYKWIGDAKATPIFWLSGLAGTGKSTIAQTVAQHLHEHHMLGASFFFSRGEASRSNPSLFFPTIAYQLACFDLSSFGDQISKVLEETPEAGTLSLTHQLEKLIAEPLCKVSPHSSTLGIVIDALDEGGAGAETLLPLLGPWISKFPFPLKVFVTSRAEPKIRTGFSSLPMQSISSLFELHKIEDTIVKADIEHFLHYELKEVAKDMLGGAKWPSDKELEKLVGSAGTLFLYAATLVKFIRNEDWSNPQHQLSVLLSNKYESRSSPFHEVDRLYLHILHNAITDKLDTLLFARFHQVVGTIILLRDPLPVESLAALLGITTQDIFAAVAKFHSVFIVPNFHNAKSESIHVLHPSFPEFLTDSLRCIDEHFVIKNERCHTYLAHLSLQCMMTHLQRDICELQDFSKLNSEVSDLGDRLQEHVPPELKYACIHWAYHLSQASPMANRLLVQLRQFCLEKLLYWLEVLSLLGSLNIAIPAIKMAIQWCQTVCYFLVK